MSGEDFRSMSQEPVSMERNCRSQWCVGGGVVDLPTVR